MSGPATEALASTAFTVKLSPPDVGELEQEYVREAMSSGWVAPAGPALTAFEDEVAAFCGRQHAVALSSGTAALHLGLLALGVGPGDVVVTSTMTFAATANAIVYCGARPFFVDCDPSTANIDLELLEKALVHLRSAGQRVAAVVAVDMLGKCCDYRELEEILQIYEVPLFCDAAESMGSAYGGRRAGSMGAGAAFSFNGNKIMTTSGGGMLVTDDPLVAGRVRHLATQARQPVVHYEHHEVGYNYRLSNILAALGRAQLQRLPSMMARRRHWRERYRAIVEEVEGVRLIGGDADAEDNCWLTGIRIPSSGTHLRADLVGEYLARHGIETRPIWKPLHLQPAFRACEAAVSGAAARLFAEGLMLPSGSGMTDEQFGEVERALGKVLGG